MHLSLRSLLALTVQATVLLGGPPVLCMSSVDTESLSHADSTWDNQSDTAGGLKTNSSVDYLFETASNVQTETHKDTDAEALKYPDQDRHAVEEHDAGFGVSKPKKKLRRFITGGSLLAALALLLIMVYVERAKMKVEPSKLTPEGQLVIESDVPRRICVSADHLFDILQIDQLRKRALKINASVQEIEIALVTIQVDRMEAKMPPAEAFKELIEKESKAVVENANAIFAQALEGLRMRKHTALSNYMKILDGVEDVKEKGKLTPSFAMSVNVRGAISKGTVAENYLNALKVELEKVEKLALSSATNVEEAMKLLEATASSAGKIRDLERATDRIAKQFALWMSLPNYSY